MALHKHIIFIGFKSAGKSAIGRRLADSLNENFVDLDDRIEQSFTNNSKQNVSCRDILNKHGEKYFRKLEAKTLKETLLIKPSIIALGGGTPLMIENRDLIKQHLIIHVTAMREKIFERIANNQIPSFFPSDKNPLDAFLQLWEDRNSIYYQLTPHIIYNNCSIKCALKQALSILGLENLN